MRYSISVVLPSGQSELRFGDRMTGMEARRAWHDPDLATSSAKGLLGPPPDCAVIAVRCSWSSWSGWGWDFGRVRTESFRDNRSCTHARIHASHNVYDMTASHDCRYIRLFYEQGLPRIFHYGPGPKGRNSRPKVESGGGVLGQEQGCKPPTHQLGVCEILSDRPKVSNYFQHSGWPLLTLQWSKKDVIDLYTVAVYFEFWPVIACKCLHVVTPILCKITVTETEKIITEITLGTT